MNEDPETVRIIRVFVSSPSDVAEERKALDEVVARINRTDGAERKARLEVWKWEEDSVPQIGPEPQEVIDRQLPPYDIYLGIMKHRFGTRTGQYGSGTEKEFNDALNRWGKFGKPWILFYFSREVIDPEKQDLSQCAKVQRFRKKLEKKGLHKAYLGVRGSKESFAELVDEHLRKVLYSIAPLAPGVPEKPPAPIADPSAYLQDLLEKTSHIEIRGLMTGQQQVHRFPIEDLFITLTATQTLAGRDQTSPKGGRKGREKGIGREGALGESRTLPLDAALRHDRLVVIGDPGAGKTTFLRRLANVLCQTELGQAPEAARTRLGIGERTFPILIRLNELDEYISRHKKDSAAPSGDGSPALAAALPGGDLR